MKEPRLSEIPGKARLTRDFFNGLIRRIECTKPLAGSNISVEETDNGIIVNSSASDSSLGTAVTYLLNVCSNGVPDTLVVFGPPAEE